MSDTPKSTEVKAYKRPRPTRRQLKREIQIGREHIGELASWQKGREQRIAICLGLSKNATLPMIEKEARRLYTISQKQAQGTSLLPKKTKKKKTKSKV